jgi:hypothetical protein
MRKALVLAVALGALVAVPAASAGSLSGVVVAKDAKRKAVVVVSGRSVRTVRAGARFARVRVGQRVAATVRKRADGTYDAGALRATGRAKKVRFGAVVVKHERALRRLILSGGGSVFAIRVGAGGRSTASASGGGLQAGDRVQIDAHISAAATWSGDAHETGRAKLVELEGIFIQKKGDGFDVAIVARGLVHVEVPEGAVLPDFEAGDQISLLVLIGKDGSFTYIRGVDEAEKPRPRPVERPKEGFEVNGVLAEKNPYAVTVRSEDDKKVQCAVPAGMELSIFRVGERVKLRCVSRENRDVLVKIQSNYGWVKADGTGELSVYGALTKGASTVSVRREDGMSMTCSVPAGVNLSSFRAGEAVKMWCRLGAEGFVFGAMYSESASLDSDGVLELHASGLLQARSAGGPVSVRKADGSLFSCSAPEDFQLSYFTVGQRVTMSCRVDGDARALLRVESERYLVGADGSVEVTLQGVLSAKSDASLSVTAADGAVVSCSMPAGTDLSAFPLGTSVKLHCHKLAGEFRLEYLKSEHAVVEVGS